MRVFYIRFHFQQRWNCCISGLSRSYSSVYVPEELPPHAQDDGNESLHCWPPRAPVHSTGAGRTGSARRALHSQLATTFSSGPVSVTAGPRDTSVVDAVMKRFPPPPGPDDREAAQTGSSERLNSSRTSEYSQTQKSCGPTDQPNPSTLRPAKPNSAAVIADKPLAPGLEHTHTHTRLSGTDHTLFPAREGGSSFQWLQRFGGTVCLILVGLWSTVSVFQSWHQTSFPKSVFFSRSVCSHLPLTEPRQQTETTEAGEENPPKPPSVRPAEQAGEQPEPTNLYASLHWSHSWGA